MFRIAPFRRRSRMETLLPQTLGDWFSWPEGSWQSFDVDVKESEQGYVLQADLPGVEKGNINLAVENGYLTIGVSQEEIKSENSENYVCRERRQLSSRRSFYVGNIDTKDVSASYENGVLEVTFPKGNGQIDSRNIPIQ